MDKLTLEHLAPYLPYGLKVVSKINNYSYTLLGACKEEILIQDDLNGWYATNIFKPILRPLSDLNESDLFKNWNKEHSIELRYGKRVLLDVSSSTCIDIVGYPLSFLTDLFKNHFDVFGLIEKGFAIDINSIEGKETNS